MSGINILGYGRFEAPEVVTNDDLSKRVETNDEWIRTRTGIAERRYLTEGMRNYDMAVGAAKQALEQANVDYSDIAFCLVGTFTPDYATPMVASMVQKTLGLPDTCTTFDINGACSGFMYTLHTAKCLLDNEPKGKKALVIGSDTVSRRLDHTDRGTCILFGDGAGAIVIELDENSVYDHVMGSRGEYDVLHCGTDNPADPQHVVMNGQEVFKFAVGTISKCVDELLEKNNLTIADIDYVVCHQANGRIIDKVRRKYKETEEKFFTNIEKFGNTSAGSIPLVLSEMADLGKFKKGQKIIVCGFGAGLTWGGILIEL